MSGCVEVSSMIYIYVCTLSICFRLERRLKMFLHVAYKSNLELIAPIDGLAGLSRSIISAPPDWVQNT